MRRKRWMLLILSLIVLISIAGCDKKKLPTLYNPLNGRTTAVFNPDKTYGTVTDIDGNVYKTIVIGDQTWMAENLRVTRYRTGDTIPNITGNDEWSELTTGAYCNYNNTANFDTIATYGRLYNWYAVTDSRNIAPNGWRAATPEDWNILINYLGGDAIAGGKLKEAGGYHWDTPINIEKPDNSSGFTGLPGGWRYYPEGTDVIGFYGVWWSTGENSSTIAAFLLLYCWDKYVDKGFYFKSSGYSVRCIKE